MGIIDFVLIFTGFLDIILGLLVFFRNRRSQINLSFAFFNFSLGGWAIGIAFFRISQDPRIALIWAKEYYISASLIAASLLFFANVFPKGERLTSKKILLLILPSLLHAFLLSLPTYLTRGIIFHEWGKEVILGKVEYLIYNIYFLPFFYGALYILWKKYKKSTGYLNKQLKFIFISILIASVFGVTFNLILPWVNYGYIYVGPPFTIIIFWLVFYSILRHKLLDIRLIVARTVSFMLLIIYVIFVYSLLFAFALSVFTGLNLGNKELVISAILFLIMAFTVQPIRRGIEKVTDKIFYKDRYDAGKLLYSLALKMASTINLEELLHQLLRSLLSEMRVSRGVFVLMEGNKTSQVVYEGYKTNPEFDESKLQSLLIENRMLIFEELAESPVRELMRVSDFSVVIPLRTQKETIGLLALGEKLSGDVYSASDIQVLETFGPEAAVAIENARSYEEISKFNVTLREEVVRATSNLQKANERLEELDHLKDDFVSLASHELRTPMTAIKSYLWMAIAGKGGALNEKQMYYVQRSYVSVDRLIKLVNDMLNISRIESGRLTVKMQQVKLEQLVRDTIEEVTPRAKELGVNVLIEQQEGVVPEVLADADKIKEVLYNLIGNSMKFTPSGGKITVSFVEKDNMVEVVVKDTGSGIAEEDLPKLFQKFGILPGTYVTNQAVSGTGLGLYICRSLVELHGGKIWASSEGKGKGTTFIFSLKVFNQEDLNKFSEKYNHQSEEKVGLIHTQIG